MQAIGPSRKRTRGGWQSNVELTAVLSKERVQAPVYLDVDGAAAARFNNWGMPTLYVLDADAHVIVPGTTDVQAALLYSAVLSFYQRGGHSPTFLSTAPVYRSRNGLFLSLRRARNHARVANRRYRTRRMLPMPEHRINVGLSRPSPRLFPSARSGERLAPSCTWRARPLALNRVGEEPRPFSGLCHNPAELTRRPYGFWGRRG